MQHSAHTACQISSFRLVLRTAELETDGQELEKSSDATSDGYPGSGGGAEEVNGFEGRCERR